MTSRERLYIAFSGGKPDRVPVYVRGVNSYEPNYFETHHPSFRPLGEYVRDHCDFFVHGAGLGGGVMFTGYDGLEAGSRVVSDDGRTRVVQHYLATPKGELTQEVASPKDQPGLVTKYWITRDEDVERFLSIPYEPIPVDTSPVKRKQDELGDRALVCYGCPVPAYALYRLLGSETLSLWSLLKRDVVEALVSVLTKRWVEALTEVIRQGPGPMVSTIGEEVITPPLHPPTDFEAFIVEPQREIYAELRTRDILIHTHCHGNLKQVLPLFHTLGTTSLHPVETVPMGDITLEEFREMVGTDLCIKGNVQVGDLFSQTPEFIRDFCRHTIEIAGADGALILAPSASPYLRELTPQALANYKAMVDAGLEFGRYD
jgi:uroporphyrinogen decarboxylase-like protein